MKFKCSPYAEWYKWYAWYPVRVQGNKIVWLEYVERWFSSTAYTPLQHRELREDIGTTIYDESDRVIDELSAPLNVGDLFCFGCEHVSKDLMITLEQLGVTSSKEKDLRNVCKAIIDTVAFHIKKDL